MIAVAVVLASLATTQDRPPDWIRDEAGRFRVGFDPGSRVVLGMGWSYLDGSSQLRLEGAFKLRHDDRDDDVTWKLSHVVGETRARLGSPVQLSATLYRGEFLRWSRAGAITIPTVPPAHIPFPLDIGFSITVADLEPRLGERYDLGLIGAELVFDAWRSPRSGSSLILAVGPRWDLLLAPDSPATHVVAPFSVARLTLHHEWSQGRQLIELEVSGGTRWTSAETWVRRIGAGATWEWIALAVNDRPLSLYTEGGWAYDELRREAGHLLTIDAGVRLGL